MGWEMSTGMMERLAEYLAGKNKTGWEYTEEGKKAILQTGIDGLKEIPIDVKISRESKKR